MKKGTIITIVVIGIVVLMVARYGISANNNMVEKQEGVRTAWSQVENQYQRRADLIPNLVNTVKGYATHEEQTLTNVIEARAKATQVKVDPDQLTDEALQKYMASQNNLSQALGRLMVVAEQYPELKANENFQMLQTQLEGTENRITTERQRFNETAREYNIYIRKFPRNIFAGILGFKPQAYFESIAGAEVAPVVAF
ncbi:MAG: LemA family protein [Porphyromonas somerae]|uniref:LemA family protein n=1 Tax=Porphyromonas somerae TaxID=322095 RepID=UPI0026F34EE1|nr:LemA family protein [Porphyromonas somerae]MDD7558422.1 LemA family protein [Porphyromonas somerae]MDY3119472.1 LemA family protein [Porphyromonas somerae]MDY3884986.1 LemA family protein [Porphyromonas somerae]MDY5816133.1 LemA family protein [Porphyromonas somerae]